MTDLVEQVVARAVRSNALARSGASKEERMVHAKEAARLAMMAADEFQKLSGAQRQSLPPSVSQLLGGGDAKEIFHNLLRPMSSETMARRFPFPSASDIALQKVLAGALQQQQQQQPSARHSEECKDSMREAEECKASLREAEGNLASARQRESRAQQQVTVPAGMLERTRAAIRRYQESIRKLEDDLSRSTSLITILQQNLRSNDRGGACLVERVEGESPEQVRRNLEAQYPDSDITVVEAGADVMSGGGGAMSFLVSVRPRTQKGAAKTIYMLQKSLAALRKLKSRATANIAARDADRKEKLSTDLEGTKNRLQQAIAEIETTKRELTQATTDLAEARENVSSATREKERLEKGLEEMRVTRTTADETCRERIQGMTSQLEAKASELESTATDLASRTSELESANKAAEDARGEVERVAQRVAELERTVDEKTRTIQQLKHATEEKTQNVQGLERAVSEKAHELESTRSAAQTAAQACESDKSEAAQRLAAATRDLRSLRNDIATRDAQITDLTGQLDSVTRERDAYVVNLEKRLESIRSCETSLNACRASHARRSSEETKESRETSEAHRAEKATLVRENRTLMEQHAALVQKLTETEEKLAQEIGGRATERREFEAAVEACGADKASAQELAERLRDASSASIQQLRDLASRLGVQGAESMSVGDVVNKLGYYRNPEELRSCQRETEEAQRKLDETRVRCEAETQLNAKLVELGTELFQCPGDPVACLRTNVQSILEAARVAEERAETWQATVSRQRGELDETRRKISHAERKAAEAERKETEARENANQEKEKTGRLRADRDRLRESVVSLQTELQSLRTNEAATRREAETSKARLVEMQTNINTTYAEFQTKLQDEKNRARDVRETSEKAKLDLQLKAREAQACANDKKSMERQEEKLRGDMRDLEEAIKKVRSDKQRETEALRKEHASAVESAVGSTVTNMRREIEASFQQQTAEFGRAKDAEITALRREKDSECRKKVRKETSAWQKINRDLTKAADWEKNSLEKRLAVAEEKTMSRDREIDRLAREMMSKDREAKIIAKWSDPQTQLGYYGISSKFNNKISFNSTQGIIRKINNTRDSRENKVQFWSWFSDASTASQKMLSGATDILTDIPSLEPMVAEIKEIQTQIDTSSYESVQSNWRRIQEVFRKYGDMYANGTLLPTQANEEDHQPPDFLPDIAWTDTASWVR